jgi:hypothetical protein
VRSSGVADASIRVVRVSAGVTHRSQARVVPTVARIGPYRFFFFSNEGSEPPHIHVQRDRALAKFWLRPIALASASGFAGHELRRIQRIVARRRARFEEAWREFFAA